MEITRCYGVDVGRLTGHRQITDAHLLALAVRKDGCLANFDAGITALTDDLARILPLRTPST